MPLLLAQCLALRLLHDVEMDFLTYHMCQANLEQGWADLDIKWDKSWEKPCSIVLIRVAISVLLRDGLLPGSKWKSRSANAMSDEEILQWQMLYQICC